MAKAKTPPRSNQAPLVARPPPPSGVAPMPELPSMDDSLSAAVAAAKKKKKKGKGKKADDELGNGNLLPQPISNTPFSATAQAQADLLATASDLYRRIEADPQGIPDDDAYWTSLPSHLRTFIRNALPIGQLPPSARNDSDDPSGRHASTQAMIAVAQQLAQAAHASQRHLQQHPPSGNANFQNTNNVAYPPFPFDPSVFADIALQTEQILPLHSHPNGADYRYSHANPPPTQPPGEPLPAPVVLVNEFDDEQGEFDDDYYSDDDMDPQEAATLDSRDGTWSNDLNGGHPNGLVAKTQSAAAKKKNKKKKKKGGTEAVNAVPPPTTAPLAPPPNPPRTTAALPPTQAPFINPPSTGTRSAAQSLPPSSRAAGKQPMTFNAAGGKAPVNTRPTNGHTHSHGPVSNAVGKLPASTAASSHEQGSVNGAQSTTRAWSSSSAEERERIKEFWLGLNERERKNLIKIEKDGVLRKMKEQQKHGCSCAVCGRKRSSIEDELEVLYDAYYDELEQYASDQQRYVESGGQVPPPPGPGPFPGSVALDSQGAVIGGNALTKPPSKRHHQHTHPPPISRTKAALPPEDDEAYDEDLEDDDYEDEYEYEDEEDDEEELDEPEVKPSQRRRPETGPPRAAANNKASNDLFNFGSSLTVKGGILTVADDLLKNDGQKFLEMMEQLAERRALREEEVQAELDNASEEEELDEEDEEDDEEEPEDALTDEQRMEEGRRMFQIFAARMFEQRVLQAYRERVAQERQLQLLRELEDEDNAEKEREAKKAKENQKKKDKKKQAKQQKEEERIKLEEAKAAEEAAAKAKIERQREAELKKQDEIRLKREAEKRQKDEEKAKKEEERRKRQEEERNRELEKERKKREKEEKIRAEREAKEVKEREAREAKAKEEEERKAKEQQQLFERQEKERLAKEEQAKAEAEKLQREQQAREAAAAAAARQPSPEMPSAKSLSATAAATLPRSPASSPVARKVNANLPPSSPAQLRTAAPLPSSVAPLPRGAGMARPALPNQSMASPSTLPAPPQGLPARPSTVSHASTASPSILAGGSSLPRPPIQAPTSIGSPARQGTPSNSTSSPANLNKMIPPTLASAPLLPSGGGSGSSFAKSNVGSSAPLSHQPSQPHGRYPMMAFGSSGSGSTPTRSPPAVMPSNGFMSGSNGKSAFDSVLGSPSSVNATTAGLASLNMGGANSSSQMPIGPIGGGMPSSNAASSGPLHSRNPSMGASSALDDYGRQAAGNSGSSRLLSRPAPGPIGPIGQQRRDINLDEMAPGGITSSIFGSNPLPERILGSSALGGDDELVEPQPRRTSHHTAPISNSLFGTGAFGVTSPWASTFAGSGAAGTGNGSGTVPRTPSTPGSSMLHGALGTGLTSPTSVTGSSALGSIHQTGQSAMQPPLNTGVDPWARASTGWDRARFAFEQPGSGQQQSSAPGSFPQQQQQQQSQTPVGASPLSPFGAQSQHQLRGMFGAPGQANQMSPHRHTTDRGGL